MTGPVALLQLGATQAPPLLLLPGALTTAQALRPVAQVLAQRWRNAHPPSAFSPTMRVSCLATYSCPPHLQLNDPMTPSSYEPTALRAALLEAVDEQQLCRRAQRGEGFADWFQSWWQDQCAQARSNASTQLVLKHPLLAFVMPEMAAVCNPRWLIMMRPFSAIETSRQRRGWGAPYGAAGASRLYQAIFEHLLAQPDDALMLNFERFRQDPASRKRLIDWLGLAPSAQGQVQADAWVRGKRRHAMAATPPDAAQLTQSRGQRQLKHGQPMESAEDNLAELTRQAEAFAAKQLPMLKALGVV